MRRETFGNFFFRGWASERGITIGRNQDGAHPSIARHGHWLGQSEILIAANVALKFRCRDFEHSGPRLTEFMQYM